MVNYEDIVDIYTVLGTHSVGMVLSTPSSHQGVPNPIASLPRTRMSSLNDFPVNRARG